MATFHVSVKSGNKGTAKPHAQYIAREGKHAEKADLVATGHGNLPDWAHGSCTNFWSASDKYERKNGSAYREFEIALPNEISEPEFIEIAERLINELVGDRPYQYAIHNKPAALGHVPQPHLHLMYSDRINDDIDRSREQHFRRFNPAEPQRGGCRKASGGKLPAVLRADLIAARRTCADIINAALQASGYDARVDHRSNAERGIAVEPGRHLGPARVRLMTQQIGADTWQ